MLRIAYCSPVNPAASGISDYSEELLPYLGQYAELDLFTERGLVPTNPDLQRCLTVLPIERLAQRHAAQPYDAVIYHMGNSPAHTTIYQTLLQVPGVVVLHDWVLHHFKLGYAAAHQRLNEYQAELEAQHGTAGKRAAARMLRGQLTDAVFEMPLNADILAAARGLIGHSQFLVRQAQLARPDLPSALVPMGVPLPPLIDQAAARHALGLDHHGPMWASFGHINPYKRIEPALRAFRRFRAEYPAAHYLLVGSVSPNYPLTAVIDRLGLAEAVTVTGYVPAEHFAAYVAASDLCLNLRHPTAGETSASLLRLLGAGRPTLVSAGDAFAELPDAVCGKVDADRAEAALIYHYAHLLHTTPELAAALGHNARQFVAQHHTLEQAARGYIDFLAQLYGWEPPMPTRPPLWSINAAVKLPDAPAHIAPADPAPQAAVPIAGVGQALAELGVQPEQAVVGNVAGVIKDLLGT